VNLKYNIIRGVTDYKNPGLNGKYKVLSDRYFTSKFYKQRFYL
jgi:thymidylate kinase